MVWKFGANAFAGDPPYAWNGSWDDYNTTGGSKLSFIQRHNQRNLALKRNGYSNTDYQLDQHNAVSNGN